MQEKENDAPLGTMANHFILSPASHFKVRSYVYMYINHRLVVQEVTSECE